MSFFSHTILLEDYELVNYGTYILVSHFMWSERGNQQDNLNKKIGYKYNCIIANILY